LRTLVLTLAVLAAAAPSAHATKVDPAKEAEIRKLMTVTGVGDLAKQLLAQIEAQFKGAFPNVPTRFWSEFEKEVKVDDFIQMAIPIYDRYLSIDEVRAVTQFYETPVGRKLVSVMPLISRDSLAAGEKWGKDLSERISKRLQAEGMAK
jgi:hypothetical protein